MSVGPWIDTPPTTGSVLFASDQPRSVDVDAFGGTVNISPQQYGDRYVDNIYGDLVDRTQDMWDILRGFDDVLSDPGLLYNGNTFAVGPTDPWSIEVRAEVPGGFTYPTRFDYIGFWGSLYYNQEFSPTLPPGAIGIEIDGVPEGTLDVTLGYDATPSPPSSGLHALSDFAGATGILGNFPIQTNFGHYPYDLLTAMSPPPFGGIELDNLHAYWHALPSSLLDSTPPSADPLATPGTTIYRAQNCTFSTDYTITYPRYRFLFPDLPARRLWPRQDGLGLGLGRSWPTPNTRQSGRGIGPGSPP